jgi:HK97 family phage major capsid protein
MEDRLEAARKAETEARTQLKAKADEIADLADDATAEKVEELDSQLREAELEVERCAKVAEREARLAEARKYSPPVETPEEPERRQEIRVGKEEATYRPDNDTSFFRDLFVGTMRGDFRAQERLQRHEHEMEHLGKGRDAREGERRDISTAATAGGGFVPPLYLGELYANVPRQGRPFANFLGSRPLPPSGMTITIPKITTAPAVASQAGDNQNFNETNLVETTLTYYVETLGGVQDVSIQLLERSDPSIDQIVFEALRDSYDTVLDTQLISGAGHGSNQHAGIRGVASVNTVTYTDATPTAAEFVPIVYGAASQIATGRMRSPNLVVMHPRRSHWFASNLSASFPLLQVGGLNQAAGTQDGGMALSISGIPILSDANVGTTYNTDRDEAYVLYTPDLILWEGDLRAEVFRDVLSLGGTVRLRLYAFSAFASGRQAESIAIISGTGMAAPSGF